MFENNHFEFHHWPESLIKFSRFSTYGEQYRYRFKDIPDKISLKMQKLCRYS